MSSSERGRNRNNITGFSMIELMVTIGLTAIALLAASQAARSLFLSVATSEKMMEQNSLLNEASAIMLNETLCGTSLGGLSNVNGTDVVVSNNIQAGAVYGSKISITSVKLENVSLIGGTSYQADVVIIGEKLGEALAKDFSKRFKVFYRTSAGGTVISNCLDSVPDPEVACVNMGGAWIPTGSPPFCDFGQGSDSGYKWKTGVWTACNGTSMTRTVECVDEHSSATVADSKCVSVRPKDTMACTDPTCTLPNPGEEPGWPPAGRQCCPLGACQCDYLLLVSEVCT